MGYAWNITKTTQTRTIEVALEAAPDVVRRHTRQHVLIRPATLAVNLAHTEGSWRLYRVDLTGPTLKKDGQPSKVIGFETVMWGSWNDSSPEWIVELSTFLLNEANAEGGQ